MGNKTNDLPEAKNKEKISIETSKSYYHKRLEPLGVTEENNVIEVWQNNLDNKSGHEEVLVPVPIFKEVPEGIEIVLYTIDRLQITYSQTGNKSKKKFSIVRLEKPILRADGSEMKYRLPKGAGTHPFFPPTLVKKYDAKEEIQTLYLTEGYFKAWKVSLTGIDIIGLSSITHMKDKETGKLHPDIIKIVNRNNVKRVVWLTDGDALNITQAQLKDAKDLSIRPKNFFSSVTTFKTLHDDLEIEKWFFHIDSDHILFNNKDLSLEDVKGIDDLLISLPDKEKEIVNDLKSVQPGMYFQKFNITYGTTKVYNHFHLRDVKDFYLFHVERRPQLKGIEFIFNGTRYMYNEETGDCDVKIPGAAKLYFRAGVIYYKFVEIPNQYEQLERTFHQWTKQTITDDFGQKFIKHIPKYEAFCNVPNHFNFQAVINNCFNVYAPLDFEPDEDECTEENCPTIINFVKHLFGEKLVSYHDNETNTRIEYKTNELGLDYLQLLYQNPQQKLPILCLVSKENNTGKTTMGNFLRMMLGANTAIVGNADLQSDFNAHWATKSVVVCDETKIDKDHVVAKIKNLSTARKIFMNAKGRGQVELDCFIKFVLITNNEDNFIHATEDDMRYWIIKVPVLSQENPNILVKFQEEMPAFLSFINKRKLSTKLQSRMWFHFDLIKTEARTRLIENNLPAVIKEIRHYLKDMFLDNPIEEIKMTLQDIHREIFKNSGKYEPRYISKELNDRLNMSTPHLWIVENESRKFKTKKEALEHARSKFPNSSNQELEDNKKIKKVALTMRYSYPRKLDDGSIIFIQVTNPGRPYCFKRKDFVDIDDDVDLEEISESDIEEKPEILKQSDMPF